MKVRRMLMALLCLVTSVAAGHHTARAESFADGLWLEGEVGDWVLGPNHVAATAVTLTGNENAVHLTATAEGRTWFVDLEAAYNETLTSGRFESIHPTPPLAQYGRVTIRSDIRQCYPDKSRFFIDEIHFTDGVPDRLVARWDFRCSGHSTAAIVGGASVGGTVTLPHHAITRSVAFGTQPFAVPSARQQVVVSNLGETPLAIEGAQISGRNGTAFAIAEDACSGTTVAIGESCSIAIEYTPDTMSLHTAELRVFDDVSPNLSTWSGATTVLSGTPIPTVNTMFVEGEADSFIPRGQHLTLDVYQANDQYSGGIMLVGRTSGHDYTVLLYPPEGAALAPGTYEGAEDFASRADGAPGFSLSGDSLGGTSVARFIIDQLERGPGGTLTRLVARWEVHYAGWEPAGFGAVNYNGTVAYRDRAISPSSLVFGAADTGAATAAQTVTVTNSGPSTLHVDEAVLSGADASEFEIVSDACSGTTVAAAGSCTVTVRYFPEHSIGSHSARLTIFDDIAPHSGGGTGQDVVLTGSASVPADSPHGEFTPVTPARILDTRDGTGAPLAKIGPDSSIDVQVTGQGGVPASGVSAVVVNVTAVKPTANTFVTLWPTGDTRPTVSNLNPSAGKAVPNMAIVPLGADGKISAYNSLGSTDLLLDVVGYYSSYSGPAGSRFHPIEPFRAVDTRNGTGAPKQTVGPGGSLRIDLRGAGGLLPASGMTAVVLNVTAVKPTASGFVTVFPGDVARPTASNLNTSPGVTAPNLVTVRVPANGIVEFYNSAGSTHLLVDVVGYYDGVRNGEAGRFIPIAPVRSWDTRDDNDPLAPGDVTSFQIAGFDDVPADASAVAANFTAVKPTGNGYLTVFPDDVCTIPVVSTLNFAAGQIVPNMAITKLSLPAGCAVDAGWLAVYNPSGYTHVLIDVAGYFT